MYQLIIVEKLTEYYCNKEHTNNYTYINKTTNLEEKLVVLLFIPYIQLWLSNYMKNIIVVIFFI
jgi:hypothetical protein